MGKKQASQVVVAVGKTPVAPADAKRRRFFTQGASVAGTLAAGGVAANAAAQEVPPRMKTMGTPMRAYGTPSKFEEPVRRPFASGYAKVTPGAGASRTPHQSLEGTITPSGLHFERHHNGVPDIEPRRVYRLFTQVSTQVSAQITMPSKGTPT